MVRLGEGYILQAMAKQYLHGEADISVRLYNLIGARLKTERDAADWHVMVTDVAAPHRAVSKSPERNECT